MSNRIMQFKQGNRSETIVNDEWVHVLHYGSNKSHISLQQYMLPGFDSRIVLVCQLSTYFEVVVVVVVEVVSRNSWTASLPPATSLCVPVPQVAPAALSTLRKGGRKALDDQVQNGQPDILWSG